MSISAEGGGDKKTSFIKGINGEPSYTRFNINRISTWFKNDGESDHSPTGKGGTVYPKGTDKTAIFYSGLIWGAKIDSIIHVGGSTYRTGTVPGRIVDGNPVNPNDPDVRIYRVRRDYLESHLSSEIDDGEGIIEQIRAQYEKDWNEWPAAQGAPYEDLDANGIYNPKIDIPGVPGADQTLWFVFNDLDSTQSKYLYGSLPMGIEGQVTIWGYDSDSPLGNMLFRKYILINKNIEQKPFTDMYVSMWSDPDIGNSHQNLTGCDTTLNMGYVYYADRTDEYYFNSPPAVGFRLLQGPAVPAFPNDTAIFKGKVILGKKNLNMSAFYIHRGGDPRYSDAALGSYKMGTLGMYNLFQGKILSTGEPFINEITNKPTTYLFPGDPVAKTGWYDGVSSGANDVRIGVTSGSFNLTYSDTQEVVFAEIIAGATEGVDRLQAVTLLKEYSQFAQEHYDNSFYNILPPIPLSPKDNETEVETDPILNWTLIDGAISYSLQVASDIEFKNMFVEESGLTKTNYELMGLINSTTYYWRVSVQDSYGSSYYSRIFSFITKPDLLKPTLKVSPISAEIDCGGGEINFEVTNTSIGTLNWNAVSNDASWIKIISGSSGTNSGTIEVMVSKNKKEERTGLITISSDGSAGSPRVVEIKQEVAEYEVSVSTNPDSVGLIFGDGVYKYGENVKLIARNNYGYTFSHWTEKDSVISTDSTYQFVITENRSFVANYNGPHSFILQISEMEGDILKDVNVGLAPASLGPNGYILSNQAGAVNLPKLASDYDRFDYWGNDDLIIDFGEKSLAYSYFDEFIYKSRASGEVTYLPFSVYRIKYPTMEKIRLFAGFRDNDNDGIWSIEPTGKYDVNWHRPTTELIFAWQGYDTEGNEISYDTAKESQYIAENKLFTSANITWGSSTGEFKYPYLTNTMFVMYTATAKLPDANRQIRFFTAKPIINDIEEEENYNEKIPQDYSLSQNYPNPFNPTTNIRFSLTKLSFTTLKIYDILGREVATLVNNELSAGRHTYEFDGSGLSSGIYFYRLQTGEFTQTRKMLLIK